MEIKLIPLNYYVYVVVFIGHIGVFISVLLMTWSTTILTKSGTLDDNPLGRIITQLQKSILGSTPIIGSLIGWFYSGYIANNYGKKPIIMFLEVPAFLAYVLTAFSTNIWELYIGRISGGIILGGVSTLNTMYFGEITENLNRGFLGAAMACFINIGLLFVLVLGPLTSFFWFHIILRIFPAILMPLIHLFVPDSPYYLIRKDFDKEDTLPKGLIIINVVKKELNENNVAKALRKGFLIGIGCGLILFLRCSGSAIIMSYGQFIFAEAGDGIPSELGPILIMSIQFFVGFLTPLLVDKSSRKILLFISHIGITISHFLFGLYFYLKYNERTVNSMSELSLPSIIMYIITFSFGSGPVPWSMIAEIFPSEVKGVTASVCVSFVCIFSFLLLLTLNSIKDYIGIGMTFWIFSAFGILAAVFMKFYVMEAKRKRLNEIQELLHA